MNLRPGSPPGNAPAPPAGGHEEDFDVDQSIGGNMALGSRSGKSKSKSMRSSGRRGSTKSRKSFGGGAAAASRHGAISVEDDEDDDGDVEAGFNGRNAIPDDIAE